MTVLYAHNRDHADTSEYLLRCKTYIVLQKGQMTRQMTNTGCNSESDSESKPEAEGQRLTPLPLNFTLQLGSYNPESFSIALRSNGATNLVYIVLQRVEMTCQVINTIYIVICNRGSLRYFCMGS